VKTVIFGASGFIGQQLVPMLNEIDHQLLLVGRDQAKLERLFSGIATADYSNFEQKCAHFDLAINLATVNVDSKASFKEFKSVNNDLLISLAQSCRDIGIRKFINVNSVHALDPNNKSFYAQSKREGARALDELRDQDYFNIYLPSVHGEGWSGKLGVLNRLPNPIAKLIFTPLAALKPTVSVAQLGEFLGRGDRGVAVPIIVSNGQHANRYYHVPRRLVDVGFALFVLAAFWWLLILLWIGIKLDSRGPAIFVQRRIGLHGKEFACYKFRTMQLGTAQRATHEVPSSLVTRVGRFLRKYKLDELPQIWNLLRNEMSLIGPRPCLPNQVELIEARKKRGVLDIKPGISGFAQVQNIDMSDPILLADTDAAYIGLRGLILDLKIALQTALGGGGWR
jgi:lipopolysaccharide/colanic/teichoic acid biosynthesis glycosyltransferase